ncbi:MAG: hypothetical protein KJ906_01470 [Nanoarchaeota archaeon]|nr:hypothetical protein [Nanoarchaeota archaeon]
MIRLSKGKNFDTAASYEKGPGREYFEEALNKDYNSIDEAVDYLHKHLEHTNWKISQTDILIGGRDGKAFELPITIKRSTLRFKSCFRSDMDEHNKIGARHGTFQEFIIVDYIEDNK